MSKEKIERLLKAKNIPTIRVEYETGCPVPGGFASGWSIDITEETEDDLFRKGFLDCQTMMEFDSLSAVTDWIETLPKLGEF